MLLKKYHYKSENIIQEFSSIQKITDGTNCRIELNDLLNENKINWNQVKLSFKQNHCYFENLLFRIHFKRSINLTTKQRGKIIHFLSLGYFYLKDIRYLNEFLFFYKNNTKFKKYLFVMSELFFTNLTSNNCHTHLQGNSSEIENFLKKSHEKITQFKTKDIDTSLNVGLLGSPTFFKKTRNHLLCKGFNVSCFFIPFHPDKKINLLLKNKITFKLLCILKKINFPFYKIRYTYKDPKINKLLTAYKLDIGFHKLGFIIKNNFINPFKVGLINDHWAILPYIRGRSTIEYSLLLDIPVIATTHLIEEGVDSGDIINFYQYYDLKQKKYSKISQIRDLIRKEREFRAIDSIELLSKTKKPIIKNHSDKGLMYYSIHTELKKHIENNILKNALRN
jgi:folate-dependent phosphoribosylglycinamide formyltransferase PurN